MLDGEINNMLKLVDELEACLREEMAAHQSGNVREYRLAYAKSEPLMKNMREAIENLTNQPPKS